MERHHAVSTQSLPTQTLAVRLIRRVLDESGSITGIKYDGKPLAAECLQQLLAQAKVLKWKKDEGRPQLRGKVTRDHASGVI